MYTQLDLSAILQLLHEALYLGIDVGKRMHVAGFVSKTCLERSQRFEACPALAVDNLHEGFRVLLERIKSYVPVEHCFVIMEKQATLTVPSCSISKNSTSPFT